MARGGRDGDRGGMVSYDDEGARETPPPPGPGIAGLSFPFQVAAAVALAVVGLLGCAHLAMVFLYVAPSNTVTKEHGKAVAEWVNPEFEQNWKLFAPNPLQQNIHVEARAEVETAAGERTLSRWIDLSAEDGAVIRGNPLPSHVDQNELRRAWDFYTGSHDDKDRPVGTRGQLSEGYVRRIVMLRLAGHDLGGSVARVQLRSSTSTVPAPPWSDEKINTRPVLHTYSWWTVNSADLPAGAGGARTRAAR